MILLFAWQGEVSYEYAKDQVKIQMNINALKVNLQEVAA